MRRPTPQHFTTLFLSLLFLLATMSTVQATIQPGLEIRYVGIPEAPVTSQPYELELDLIANESIELESYQVSGKSCIAVWKKDSASLAETGTYMLEIDTTPTGTDDPPVLPTRTALRGVYPNPFNPRTTIAFDLAQEGDVSLVVFNVRGEKVRTLTSPRMPAGNHEIMWTGIDDGGMPVVSGVYVVQLRAQEIQEVRKVTLAR